MTDKRRNRSQTILFGVTTAQSLKLLGQLPERMIDHGWDVHIVCDNSVEAAYSRLDGIQIHHLPMKRNPSVLRDVVSCLRWVTLLARVRPLIISVGTPKASLLGLVSGVITRIPIRVYHLRGLRLQTEAGLTKRMLRLAEKVTASCATHIITVSNSLRNEYLQENLSGRKNVTLLGLGSSHGVEIDYFHPNRWVDWTPPQHLIRVRNNSSLALGFVGRLCRDKGAEELLWCHRVLLEKGIVHKLLIIGPNEADDEIQKQLRLDSITLVGPVPDTAPYYSLIDILVLPTRREGFPNAVLEAAASGIPAVTTFATGAIDSVIDGQTGLLVPVGDKRALASAVEGLLLDRELRRSFGRNARTHAVTHFEATSVTGSHANFLVDLWLTHEQTRSPALGLMRRITSSRGSVNSGRAASP